MNYKKEHYAYAINLTLTAVLGSTITDYVKVGADANFIVERISLTATEYASTIFLRDTSSSKEWTSIAVRFDNFAGNYGVNNSPKILFKPKRINANNTLTITLVNATANQNLVQIVFEGYREIPV